MTAAPIHLAGERLMLDPSGVLWWPARRLLAVADLHLEKGSALAARGTLLPPYDSRSTLDRLLPLVRRYAPGRIVALGDSFHDRSGSARLSREDTERLRRLADAVPIVWVFGNHDPAPPASLPGEAVAEWREGPIAFRHEGGGATPEVCGHHHPKALVPTRGKAVSRPCFVADHRRVMLPAFGAYAGGLDVRDLAIARLFPRGCRVFLLGRGRLYSFAFAQLRGLEPAD